MSTTYYAHTDGEHSTPDAPGAHWQPLATHLLGVQELAGRFAEAAGGDEAFIEAAQWAGLLHDVGKYSRPFQQMLRDAAAGKVKARVEHSGHGAAIALAAGALDVAFAVAGHHAGLTIPRGDRSALRERCDRVHAEAKDLWERAIVDLSRYGSRASFAEGELREVPIGISGSILDLRVRMLASCLVDADRLDSGGHGYTTHGIEDAPERLARLLAYVDGRAAEARVPRVREARRCVLEACLTSADWPDGLLSLTVPTGGGKTLASMAFALRRIASKPERAQRVIVVIPYLSIIEQNASVYGAAIGRDMIVEHHSGDFAPAAMVDSEMAGDEVLRYSLATENWDAPVVVTTSVRFFESLFSNRPSDLRRLHNIAQSVVILDEVQTLPRQYLRSLLSMMHGLAHTWGTTFVFCTATQPAFERRDDSDENDVRWSRNTVREIIPSPKQLFADLRRVSVTWPGSHGTRVRWSWDEVAAALALEPRALCIVNLRDHAELLYRKIAQQPGVDVEGLWHLSTRMCPQHRMEFLRRIRGELAESTRPCRVIATQLVEAGVDLDFPVVFRAVGPLDSIAQAAGRCDREGQLTAAAGNPAGRLIVFEPNIAEAQATPPGSYRDATRIARSMMTRPLSIESPSHIAGYFNRYYNTDLDPNDIEALRKRLAFRDVADRFAMIDQRTAAVVVPYDEVAEELIRTLALRQRLDMATRRALQRYQVGLYEQELSTAYRAGAIMPAWPGSAMWICTRGFYKADVGFDFESKEVLIL